ncbi:AAA family ATPase [Candidatus Woesearchaeota archaeon]|nr:AAA family ATPase [Candidatus Woesearchaeota archaeon]
MTIFDDMLKEGESLFRDEIPLDFSYIPKPLKYRENEQRMIAACMKPLFENSNGRNVFICGRPGIGKTVAVRHLLNEIEDNHDEVIPLYVNCWQKNTTYKIMVELCEQLDYKFTQNKKTEELVRIVANIVNKKTAAFAFDEIDKAEDLDFIYTILEQVFKKSIVLLTNYKDWLLHLDSRIKSRLLPDIIEFKPYNAPEIKGILEQRMTYAFVPGVWEDDALALAVAKTCELEDIRTGLHLLKESGLAAEAQSSKKISIPHVEKAIEKLELLSIKSSEDLEDEARFILGIVKDASGKKIGDLFKIYLVEGGKSSYKTFQRKIQKLSDNGFVGTKKISGGPDGSTTIVNYLRTKKLTDF